MRKNKTRLWALILLTGTGLATMGSDCDLDDLEFFFGIGNNGNDDHDDFDDHHHNDFDDDDVDDFFNFD
jgi:hypothetical protein